MEFKELLFQVQGAVATMTLNRADIRNAITHPEIISEIKSVCALVNEDMAIKTLIVTAVDPAFCSGGNVKEMKDRRGMFQGAPAEVFHQYGRAVQGALMAVYNVEVPTIAAVNGSAIGGGCGLTLMCDIRVASKNSTFGQTVVSIGLVPGDGSAWTLPRAVGLPKAYELLFTSDVIDAETALSIGLVNYLADHDKLLDKANEIANKIASKPPRALRLTKRLIRDAQHSTLDHAMQDAAAIQSLCHFTSDHMEALSAMFEKRKPQFTGK